MAQRLRQPLAPELRARYGRDADAALGLLDGRGGEDRQEVLLMTRLSSCNEKDSAAQIKRAVECLKMQWPDLKYVLTARTERWSHCFLHTRYIIFKAEGTTLQAASLAGTAVVHCLDQVEHEAMGHSRLVELLGLELLPDATADECTRYPDLFCEGGHLIAHIYYGEPTFLREALMHHLAFSTQMSIARNPAACAAAQADPSLTYDAAMLGAGSDVAEGGVWGMVN